MHEMVTNELVRKSVKARKEMGHKFMVITWDAKTLKAEKFKIYKSKVQYKNDQLKALLNPANWLRKLWGKIKR